MTDVRAFALFFVCWCRRSSGDVKGNGSSAACKNLNDSSNSVNSSGDESSDEASFARTSDLTPVSRSSFSYQPQQPSSSAVSATSSHLSLYHPGFKFEHSMGPLSHYHHQPFGDMSGPSLVMQKGNEAMLHLSAAAAAGVDYSSMSAIGSLAPALPSNH